MAADSIVLDRLRDKERGWAWVARRFAALEYRQRVRGWALHSALGHVDPAGTEVIARGLGRLTARMADGTIRTLDAPVPFA